MKFLKPAAESRAVPARVALLSALAILLGLWSIAGPIAVLADRADKGPEGNRSDEPVPAFLAKHCKECHSGAKPKGDFSLDQLVADPSEKAGQHGWLRVLEQLKANAMPPKGKPRPAENEVRAVNDWVRGRVAAAEAARRKAQGRVVMRRLNRVEYENTVRDLLGIAIDVKESLALDSSADGFDNQGTALHLSSFAMEKYLEAADKALNLAISNNPKPPPLIKKRYSLKDSHQVKLTTESVFRIIDDTVVNFTSVPWQSVGVTHFYPPDRGQYRIRISASGFQSADKPVTFRVTHGALRGKDGLVGYFDAPPEKATVFEFVRHFEARTSISILPYGLARSTTVHKVGADKWDGPGLAVQFVDVEGPLHEIWPPESHRRIFGDMPRGPVPIYNYRERVEVVSKDPPADAERILKNFARRAFRRAVTDEDVKPYRKLVQDKLEQKQTFEQAIRVGLLGIMVSPDFLFLREKPGPLDDFAIASRLSYFFWCSMPDDELLTLAEQKKLRQPDALRQQVERMLKDPRAAGFTENFVGQWLNLRDIDFTEPSHILYPEFDHMLKVSMIRETELFFEEVLKNNLSLSNFVASDFTMLNGRLARHYGIPGPDGWEFRKVPLPPDSHRGGVLTMASVLKVTANGTYTHPVHRGVYVMERILGMPPPKPPDGVGAVEPDVRGAKSIRQLLAKHREVGACATCHTRIDPPGFALESFDVIGGYREYYRTSGNGKPVMINGQRMPYLQGPAVDPADEMPGGQKFANIDEFKQLLLKDKNQLARALAEKLLTYGTGGAPEASDKPEIDAIVRKVKDQNYGFQTLIHEIVQSRLFLNK
jgi:mono/diheme cytochrome c family protein